MKSSKNLEVRRVENTAYTVDDSEYFISVRSRLAYTTLASSGGSNWFGINPQP